MESTPSMIQGEELDETLHVAELRNAGVSYKEVLKFVVAMAEVGVGHHVIVSIFHV